MKPRLRLPAILLAACLGACFTEIGNPDEELSMSATLRVDAGIPDSTVDGPDSVSLARFRLDFRGAVYRGSDSAEGMLWQPSASGGNGVDFVAGHALPRIALARPPMDMMLRFGAHADTARIEGMYVLAGNTRRFRFALPDSTEFTLRYGTGAMEAWRSGGEYHCDVVFHPRRWLSLPGLDTAAADSAGVIRFDSLHNPALHAELLRKLFRSFNGERDYSGEAPGAEP